MRKDWITVTCGESIMSSLPYPNIKGVNRFAVLLLEVKSHRHGPKDNPGPLWVSYNEAVELFHKLEKENNGQV
jgi:hypothetical protein